MFSQMELLLFAIFVDLSKNADQGAEAASNKAFAVFSLFLAILYAIFSGFLFTFRHFVIDGKWYSWLIGTSRLHPLTWDGDLYCRWGCQGSNR